MPAAPDTLRQPSRGAVLRRLAQEGTFAIPGAPIALVAKLIEREGFEAIYLSGAAFSAGVLGVPDIGILTLDQLVSQTRLLAAAVEIPLIVDADTGFGGPDAVTDCVRQLEAAGAAAIQLEDQRRPKRCGHLPGKEIVDTAEMCEKIAAACAARRDPATVILGRSDARGVTDLDDCLARLKAYRDAGADWLFPEALASRDEFKRVGRELSGTPLVANMTEFGSSPLLSLDELAELGFAAVLYPVTLLRLAMKAIEAGLGLIADEGTQTGLLDLMQSREELYDLLDYDPKHPERHLPAPRPLS
jgi:methylisocitrate lyase